MGWPRVTGWFDTKLVSSTLSIENLDLIKFILDTERTGDTVRRYVVGSSSHGLIGMEDIPPFVDL